MAHARAMLADSGSVIAVRGDARHPYDFITDDAARELVDFSRPVGLLFVAVLHFITDDEDPYGSVAWVRDRIAPGSYLAVSHVTSDGTDPAAMALIQDAYKEASASAVFRKKKASRGSLTGSNSSTRPLPRSRNGVTRTRGPRLPPCGSSALQAEGRRRVIRIRTGLRERAAAGLLTSRDAGRHAWYLTGARPGISGTPARTGPSAQIPPLQTPRIGRQDRGTSVLASTRPHGDRARFPGRSAGHKLAPDNRTPDRGHPRPPGPGRKPRSRRARQSASVRTKSASHAEPNRT